MPTLRIKPIFVHFLFFSFIFACFSFVSFARENEYSIRRLEDCVKKYYEYEKNKQWSKTYQCRTLLFRKSVSFKLYEDSMEKNSKGWQLLRFDIKSINIKNNLAIVKIIFLEKSAEGYLPKYCRNKKIKIKEETLWEKINGIWYIRKPGSRNYLSLNIDLVR